MSDYYLNPGLAIPRAQPDGLDAEYWQGLSENKLIIQRCSSCKGWQWGPEWLCHRCHSFEMGYEEVAATGVIYSHERIWHPIHPALKDQGPYIVVLVELPQADNVRVVGNLLGDPEQPLKIGAEVTGVFEHHADSDPAYTLLQWQLA
ncbi:MAG: OB-fold domain-containing protein [Pseudomonadales bacterium]|nr:OB-fold domain-containing protein [Pseudomonadales bacterium]